jgi:hypothetical protein
VTEDSLRSLIQTWCEGEGRKKIEKNGIDLNEVAEEIFVYVYVCGNQRRPADAEGLRRWEIVMTLYQELPEQTRNWVVGNVRPPPEPLTPFMASHIAEQDAIGADKLTKICAKYLTARVRYRDRIEEYIVK